LKPVTVEIEVPQRREEIFDFLDVLGNHERFTDHFLVDWTLSGAESGVGAKARMRVKGPRLSDDWLDMEVIAAVRPWMSMEESVSANGRRVTRGTYLLERLPNGRTRIAFEFIWLRAPLIERLAAPITRGVVRRANARSLERLAGWLETEPSARTDLVYAGNGKEEWR
jgi:hypothetical protein